MAEQGFGNGCTRVSPQNLRRARQRAGLPTSNAIGYISEVTLPLNLLLVQRLQQNLDARCMESPWIVLLLRSQADIFHDPTNLLNLDEEGDIWVFRDGSITLVGRISTIDPTSVSGPSSNPVVQDDRSFITSRSINVFEGSENIVELESDSQPLSNFWDDATTSGSETETQQATIFPYNTIQHSSSAAVGGAVDGQHIHASSTPIQTPGSNITNPLPPYAQTSMVAIASGAETETQQVNALSAPIQTPGSNITNPWSPALVQASMVAIASGVEMEAQRNSNTSTNKLYFPVYDRNFDVGVNPL